MVTVTVTPTALEAQGHAGWAQHGSDVVCAAVSTLLQAACLGLSEVAGVPVDIERTSGYLRLGWPRGANERADVRAIVDTATRSIGRIALQFPENVTLEETHG